MVKAYQQEMETGLQEPLLLALILLISLDSMEIGYLGENHFNN